MCNAQAVVMGEKVYVGGGDTVEVEDRHHVFQYHTSRDEWSRLPPHPLIFFGIAQFAGHLITVGGEGAEGGYDIAAEVYHFKEQSQEWEEFLMPMPIARHSPSVATTQSAIIASGGVTDGETIPCATVEVYSSESSQWYTADPLPAPYYGMTHVTIADTYYLLGGDGDDSKALTTTTVLCASLSSLVEKATSPTRQSASRTSVWMTLPDTPLKVSTAASLSGHLIAVGGYKGKTSKSALVVRSLAMQVGVTLPVSPELHVFCPLINSWIRMADSDLPQSRHQCTAIQLSSNTMLVIGGCDKKNKFTKTVFIGQ